MGVALAHAWSVAWSTAVPTVAQARDQVVASGPRRRCHVPRECEDNPYQHGADGGCEPGPPTAGAEEPLRSRPSMQASPLGTDGAYHRAESTRSSRHQKVISQLQAARTASKRSRTRPTCPTASTARMTRLKTYRLRSTTPNWRSHGLLL